MTTFAFHYPETNGAEHDMLESGAIGDVAAAAEHAGFGIFALTEHPVPSAKWLQTGGHQSIDPFIGLAFAAAATTRLRLLTHLVVAPYRNPFILAKTAATLDKLSGGRLILGLGAGYQKSEFFALGVDHSERGALFDEVLDCLPLHWSGERFSYQGRHFNARDVIALPKPVQNPIPIWIGGNSGAARRRTAQRAHGWMPMLGSAELSNTAQTAALTSFDDIARAIAEVKQRAADAGRTDSIDFLCSYPDRSIHEPDTEPDRHRESFAAMTAAGVTAILVTHPRGSSSRTLEFLEAFGTAYIR